MNNRALQKAINNAESSINMEGLSVSESCKDLCMKLLREEISFEEYLHCITEGKESYGV